MCETLVNIISQVFKINNQKGNNLINYRQTNYKNKDYCKFESNYLLYIISMQYVEFRSKL